MSLKDAMERLADLYTLTGDDWILEVHHILTEPTCPTVTIRPEGSDTVRYRYDCDTIEEGIERACAHVYAEVVEKKKVGHAAPFTNPDDRI